MGARITFQLKGIQILGLGCLWAVVCAGLFLVGALVGYRNFEAESLEPAIPAVEDQTTDAAHRGEPWVPQAGVQAPVQEDSLDLIYRMRTQTPATPFGEEIYQAASEQRVNPALVAAIVWIESQFDPTAVSKKGAIGLMQVMPQTAKRFGYEAVSMTDPAANLAVGSQYLRWLAQRYSGDLALIVGGYNAGAGAIDRYGGMPPYPETRNYVRKVLAAFRSLEDDMYATARIN